jgi:hypothetical protein
MATILSGTWPSSAAAGGVDERQETGQSPAEPAS